MSPREVQEGYLMQTGRIIAPLLWPGEHTPPTSARQIVIERCDPAYAVALNKLWHSRLPHAQASPWKLAFHGHADGVTYGVALWHNPSARGLPQDWLELRRLAIAPDAPKYAATRMLGQMARWIRKNTECRHLVSYQDTEVHTGTIYKAANWHHVYTSKARSRDRSKGLVSRRSYRTDANGHSPAGAEKNRWELQL